MRFLRSNTAVIVTVGPFYDKTDGVTIETALTITNERITLTADTDAGSAPTNILDNITGATSATANDLNYITGNDAGMMQLELAAADVNRVGRMFLSITDAANHVPVFHEFFVLPQAIYDWFTGVIVPLPANVTQWLGTAAAAPTIAGVPEVDVTHWIGTAAATPTVAGVPEVDLTHVAGATTNVSTLATGVAALPTAAVTADAVWDEDATGHQTTGTFGQAIGDPVADTNTIFKAVVTDAAGATVGVDVVAVKADTAAILVDTGTTLDGRIPAALVGGRIDATVDATGMESGAVAAVADGVWDELRSGHVTDGSFGQSLQITRSATAQAGAAGTITLDASASATNDLYNGMTIFILAGTGALQARQITDYVGATKVATIEPNWVTNPASDSVFLIFPTPPAATSIIASVADAVWDEALAGHVGAGSAGEALDAAGTAGDPWVTALPGAYGAGTAGKIIGDVSGTKAVVDAILVDTGTTLDAALAVVDANVDAILVDTAEIGAAGAGLTAINLPNQTMDIVGNITGNLSGSVGSVTGAVGSVTGAVGSVTGAVGSVTGLTASNVGAIKTKTDQLTFTNALKVDATALTLGAGIVDAAALAADAGTEIAAAVVAAATATPLAADVKKINAVTVNGAGVVGDEWGP